MSMQLAQETVEVCGIQPLMTYMVLQKIVPLFDYATPKLLCVKISKFFSLIHLLTYLFFGQCSKHQRQLRLFEDTSDQTQRRYFLVHPVYILIVD